MAHLKDLIVNGVSRFLGKVYIDDSQITTINNSTVGDNPKFTDTVTTATTSGNGNAVTAVTASNGALTVTKGTTFLTSHQDISGKADKSATVSTVAWDATNKKLTKTINGSTTDVVTAATLRTGLNVADGAEVNQNAFSNVTVGSTTIAADSKTDTLTLVAGSNVTLTPDATNDKVTIAATDTTYSSKTAASGGTDVSLVTTGEKYTWNNKSSLALGTTSSTAYRGDYGNTAYTHATDSSRLTTAKSSGLYKVAVTNQGHVASATEVAKADITGLGIPAQDTTYTFASGTNGFTVTPSGGTAQTVTVAPSNSWEIDFNGSASASVPGQDIQDMRSAYAGGSEVYVRATGVTISGEDITNMNFDFHMTTVGQTGTFALIGTAIDSDFADTVVFLSLTITPNAVSTAAGTAEVSIIGDSNTTYTFANGTNGFTVTPSGGSAQTVTVTPSISNNITGSGTRTSGYLAKFSEANKITNGPQIGSSTTTYLRNDGSWATPVGTTYDAVTYNANGLSRADMYRRIYNLSSEDGSQRSDYSYYFYSTGSDGTPAWRNNITANYEHGGLFGVGQYRTLFNFNDDGTRTNTSRNFYGLNASGTPGWYDYTATDSLPGWMSAADKAKLDAINVPNIVAGTKASVANSTRTTIASYKTTVAGTFFVFGTLTYTGTVASGALRAVINTTTGGWGQCFSQVATTSKGATVTCFYAYEAAANTTFYLLGSQTTGAAVDLLYNFGVIRLA